MIKHIVMWKLKETALGHTKAENAAIIKDKLEQLNEKLDLIKTLEVGINRSLSNTDFDAVLISEFNSNDDLEAYLIHPLHVEIAEFIKQVRTDRAVVDFKI